MVRRKFGRICQRLSFVRCCATRRLPIQKIRPGAPKRNSGSGFLAAEIKEYDA
jgi:hypothetical protein